MSGFDSYGILEIKPGMIGYLIVMERDEPAYQSKLSKSLVGPVTIHTLVNPDSDEIVKLCLEHGFNPAYLMEILHKRDPQSYAIMIDKQLILASQPEF